ncbi:Phosphatidylinositol 4-phosphate 5-kinase 2 [Diplonema papillatum]|nr:Phosphatidylinositol 4-phosphate 5-kinase 2 [Diplonema papillatum]
MTHDRPLKPGYWGATLGGRQHGVGTQIFENGDTYTGHWVHGAIDGRGVYAYASGAKYEGDFKAQQRHGTGKYRSRNGDVYVGQWSGGKRMGQGEMTYAVCDGVAEKYSGAFRANKRSGPGRYWYGNGDVYDGTWLNDEKHGEGTLQYKDTGAMYEGGWQADKPHGPGVFTCADGKAFRGIFQDGKLMSLDVAIAMKRHLEALAESKAKDELIANRDRVALSYTENRQSDTKPDELPSASTARDPRRSSCKDEAEEGVAAEVADSREPDPRPNGGDKAEAGSGSLPPYPHLELRKLALRQLDGCKASFGVAVADFRKEGRPIVRIVGIRPRSPAEACGLKRCDAILQLAGNKVESKNSFLEAVSCLRPNTTIALEIDRGGEMLQKDILAGTTVSPADYELLLKAAEGIAGNNESVSEMLRQVAAVKHEPVLADGWCNSPDAL